MMMMRPRKPCSSYAGSAARVSDMPRQPPGSRVPESSPLRNAAISHSDTPRSPCFHPTRTRATRRLAPRQIPLVGLPRNSNDLDRPPGSFLLPSPLLLRRHMPLGFVLPLECRCLPLPQRNTVYGDTRGTVIISVRSQASQPSPERGQWGQCNAAQPYMCLDNSVRVFAQNGEAAWRWSLDLAASTYGCRALCQDRGLSGGKADIRRSSMKPSVLTSLRSRGTLLV